ncbi:lipopolysaccharide biosynthesis protein [Bythopirellula polymerisocia]|nr:lipopolysaccharide biosynthesis protein [Bythopirellula polymerisocia]
MRRLTLLIHGRNIRTSGMAMLDQAVVGGTNFLTAVLVGRQCGPTEMGYFALAMTAWYLILAVLEALVTSPFTVFVHQMPDDERSTYAGSAMAQVLGLAALSSSVLLLVTMVIYVAGYSELALVFTAMVISVPFRMVRQFARRFDYTFMHLSRALVVDMAIAVLQLSMMAALFYFDALTAALSFLVVTGVYTLTSFGWWLHQHVAFCIDHERFVPHFLKNWSLGRWLAASQCTTIAAVQSLPWVIAAFLGEAQTGVYSACAALVGLSAPLMVAVQNVLSPKSASAYAEEGILGLERVVRKTTLILALGMGLLPLTLYVAGDQFLSLSFGSKFTGHQNLLVLLAMGEMVFALGIGAISGLTVLERTDLLFRSNLASILTTLSLAIPLVGSFGLIGAAVSRLLGISVGSAFAIMCYRRLIVERSTLSTVASDIADNPIIAADNESTDQALVSAAFDGRKE